MTDQTDLSMYAKLRTTPAQGWKKAYPVEKSFEWFLIGLFIHTVGRSLTNYSRSLAYVLCAFALVLIFWDSFNQIKKLRTTSLDNDIIFKAFVIWSVGIVVRPFFGLGAFSADGFSMINGYTWLSLTVPMFVALYQYDISIQLIIKYSVLYAVCGIVALAVNFNVILVPNVDLDSDGYQYYIGVVNIPLQFLFTGSILALCFHFLSSRQRLIAVGSVIMGLLVAAYCARRGSTFMYVLQIVFAVISYLMAMKAKSRAGAIVFVTLVTAFLAYLVFTFGNSVFSLFAARLEEDTRSGMEKSLLQSFANDDLSWLFGRGINGSYYCPVCKTASNRGEIETGYLHMILKGGIVYLVLFLTLLLRAAFVGLFKSKNSLTKAFALNILAHIIFLIPSGLPAFDLEYVILWVCVFFCQSRAIRMKTDSELAEYFSINSYTI